MNFRRVRFCLSNKKFATRMNYSAPGFWIALAAGGLIVGVMSFSQQYMTKEKNEEFRIRSVIRDFCIGAFLTSIIYMFLPESIESSVTTILGTLKTTPLPTVVPEVELQLGPARF